MLSVTPRHQLVETRDLVIGDAAEHIGEPRQAMRLSTSVSQGKAETGAMSEHGTQRTLGHCAAKVASWHFFDLASKAANGAEPDI
jgi:hypothetical protein